MNLLSYLETKPSGFKGLGNLPRHWEVIRGRFVMRVNPSAPRLRNLKPEDEVSFVPMEAVGEYGGLNLEQTRVIDDVSSGYTEFQDGDVVVAKITPCFENGKAALARGLLNGAAYGTTELHVLRAEPMLDRRFLFYVAISDRFRKLGESEMYGAGGQKRVPPEFNKDFPMPMPSAAEQQQIAAFLDWKTGQIDALIARKKELLEKLKEKRIAVITQAVTKGLNPAALMRDSGIPWLGQVPQHWDVPALKFRYNVELGKMLDEKRITGEHPVSYLRNVDVQWDKINYEDLPVMDITQDEYPRYTIKENDVLVCEGGEVGRSAVAGAQEDVIGFQKAIHRLRADAGNELPKLLYYTLLWAVNTGVFSVEGASTIAHLTADQLRRYRFPRPPRSEQLAVVAYLDKRVGQIKKMTAKVESAIDRLTEYRAALITAATTGKIDVRNVKVSTQGQP